MAALPEKIRTELSHMSFQDLLKLKEKIGTKVYNDALFGTRAISDTPKSKNDFKRANKNRPQEMSSKKPMFKIQQHLPLKRTVPRDPRFDSLCGTYNAKAFKNAYSFIDKMKENDLKALKDELKNSDDPKMIKKVKYLIQRLENQLKEGKKQEQMKEQKSNENKHIIKSIKEGKRPAYKKKSEKKLLNLVSQYEQLSDQGKVKKHIERLRKKNLHKARLKMKALHSPETE
ncbi:ribosomal RNA processing protein 36 homolog [Prorops nasuta]|uniref:ribosomal RNA processing protein 36 homolog n=1 Tax=Prorops nasuta TaxID=863751 RepID=UPI0034CEBD62